MWKKPSAPNDKKFTFANVAAAQVKRQRAKNRQEDDLSDYLDKFTVTGRAFSEECEGPRYTIRDCFNGRFFKTVVFDPSGDTFYYFSMLTMFTILYNLVIIIVRSVFSNLHEESMLTFMALDYISDGIYLLDMFISCRKGFLEGGLLVRDTKRLAKKYLWSSRFVVDVLSVLPFDVFYMFIGFKAYVRLNRIAKVWRFFEFFEMAETRTNYPNFIRILHVLMWIVILIHWFGCFYFGLSAVIGFGTDTWVHPELDTPGHNTFFDQYSFCFYWATLTLTTIGDTEHPTRPEEIWFCVTCALMGVLIFATVFGNVGAMIKDMGGDRSMFQTKVDKVKRYMGVRGIGPDLQERVIKWFDYTWKNQQSVDDKESLELFPDKLRAEISIHVHMGSLRKVAILQDCEPGFLVALIVKLKLQVYSPGDFICRRGDIGKEMYIVKRGKLQVVDEDGKTVFLTLTDGSVFGEISVLNIAGNKTGNRRTANVKAVGYADLFRLTKEDLWDCLEEFPQAKKNLIEKGKQLLRKDNLLDEELAKREERRNIDMTDKMDIVRDTIEEIKESSKTVKSTVENVSSKVCSLHEMNENISKLNNRIDTLTEQVNVIHDLHRCVESLCASFDGSYARPKSHIRLSRSRSSHGRKLKVKQRPRSESGHGSSKQSPLPSVDPTSSSPSRKTAGHDVQDDSSSDSDVDRPTDPSASANRGRSWSRQRDEMRKRIHKMKGNLKSQLCELS